MYRLTCGAGQATSRNDSYHSPLVLLAAENTLLCPLKVLKVEHPTVVSWKTLPGVPGGVPEALQPPVPGVGEGRGSEEGQSGVGEGEWYGCKAHKGELCEVWIEHLKRDCLPPPSCSTVTVPTYPPPQL